MIQEEVLLKTFPLGVQKSPMLSSVSSGYKGTINLPIVPEKIEKKCKKQQNCTFGRQKCTKLQKKYTFVHKLQKNALLLL